MISATAHVNQGLDFFTRDGVSDEEIRHVDGSIHAGAFIWSAVLVYSVCKVSPQCLLLCVIFSSAISNICVEIYCKSLIFHVHLIFANFTSSIKS